MSDAHPARALPVEERLEYLTAVASVAYADQAVVDAELAKLRELCAALELDAATTQQVLDSTRAVDRARCDAIVARFKDSDLRFSLITDAMVMCFADGKVATAEAETIARYAGELGLNTAETVLIGRYVEDVLQDREEDSLSADLARELQAHPVPQRGLIRSIVRRLRGDQTK